MKKLSFILLILILAISCTKTIYVPTTEFIKGKDSIRIEKRDSIIYIDSPTQQQNVITNQKSCLSTDYSFSVAWVDTAGLLHHSIQNVPKIPLKIVYVNVYKSKVDSFYIEKTLPPKIVKEIDYKTPHWCWWLLSSVSVFVFWRFRKFFGISV